MDGRGVFITFEGIEGSGKTTQIQRLSADLIEARYTVCVTREPGGTPIAEQIRGVFLDRDNHDMATTTELLLVAAARAQHVAEVIRPALESGQIVISSRFTDATVAYQGYRGGLDLDLINQLNDIATNGLTPDLTLVLDLPTEIGLQRKRTQRTQEFMDRLEMEEIESHNEVREGYIAIAKQHPQRVKLINARGEPNQVYQRIRAEIDSLIGDSANLSTLEV